MVRFLGAVQVRVCCFNACVDIVCDVLREIVGFRVRACCVVFVRVCFATSVVMRVLVCVVCKLSCDGIWFVLMRVMFACVCLLCSCVNCVRVMCS